MPDLGNLSLSATLALSDCPNLNNNNAPSSEQSDDLTGSLYPVPVKTLGNGFVSDHTLPLPILLQDEAQNGNELGVSKRSRGGSLNRVKKTAANNDKGLEDHAKDLSEKKMDFTLPFLVGAPKMVYSLLLASNLDWDIRF